MPVRFQKSPPQSCSGRSDILKGLPVCVSWLSYFQGLVVRGLLKLRLWDLKVYRVRFKNNSTVSVNAANSVSADIEMISNTRDCLATSK